MTDAPKAGHNIGGVDTTRLQSLVERIERMNEEIKERQSDRADIFTEAKSAGFDVRTLRQVIRLRSMDHDKLQEQDNMLDLYRRALGV
jgi:uncharacterized protein (UPF0335 family)